MSLNVAGRASREITRTSGIPNNCKKNSARGEGVKGEGEDVPNYFNCIVKEENFTLNSRTRSGNINGLPRFRSLTYFAQIRVRAHKYLHFDDKSARGSMGNIPCRREIDISRIFISFSLF